MNFKYFGMIVLPMTVLGILAITLMIATAAYHWLFLTLIFWVLVSGLGIATGFHRVYSHNCYEPTKWLDFILLFFGTLGCQSSSITWVAVHMGYHHPHSDSDKDVHTPKKGMLYAFLGWTFFLNEKMNLKYAVRLLRKPHHLFFHQHYFEIVWSFVLIFLLLFGWEATLFGYCLAAFISILQDNLVNVFGHLPKFGYRNFETKDLSTNFPPLGYLGWGQGWHNNHHQYPNRFDFGDKWWEFDPCRIFIPVLRIGSIKRCK